MKEEPINIFETNTLGENKELQGVHIIDSSVFPSIPATTIGLLTMLNSVRITEEVIKKIRI